MPTVQLLDPQVSNLIAAGEVVERPASVLKELLENAIDAGADTVTAEIQNGGALLIRVTDNGCGMTEQDVQTALLRHATSKISRASDLDAIATLGFRGEALAAISSVSKLQILTRTAQDEFGVNLTCDGGEAPHTERTGCPVGTSVMVRELFFNTPARRKFLKKDSTEAAACLTVCERLALANPSLSLRLIQDGRTRLHTPGDGQLLNAVYAVFGRDFASSLYPVEGEHRGIKISGFVSTPTGARSTRSHQCFFVNGRYIRSRTFMFALEEAFKGIIPGDRYPACVLHASIDLASVDVNVHPTKTELRFADERSAFDSVYYAVRSALSASAKPASFALDTRREALKILQTPAQDPKAVQQHLEEIKKKPAPYRPGGYGESFSVKQSAQPAVAAYMASYAPPPARPVYNAPAPSSKTAERLHVFDSTPIAEPIPAAAPTAEPTPCEVPKERPFTVLGEAFSTYVFAQVEEEIWVIDKHAAHERIIYERLLARRRTEKTASQVLLQPVPVRLTAAQYAVYEDFASFFAESGFECDAFGQDTLAVRSIPEELTGTDIGSLIPEMLEQLTVRQSQAVRESLTERALFTAACKAAIKGGHVYTSCHLQELVKELCKNPALQQCPHGRPTYFVLTKRDFEKQFKR
ncbi:MAG: DNA mismatch repair endonuclease MutL [Clostridia bacterium]|nr:DNA mismatch repair endonuclease MutL [Clostridia bacterium]